MSNSSRELVMETYYKCLVNKGLLWSYFYCNIKIFKNSVHNIWSTTSAMADRAAASTTNAFIYSFFLSSIHVVESTMPDDCFRNFHKRYLNTVSDLWWLREFFRHKKKVFCLRKITLHLIKLWTPTAMQLWDKIFSNLNTSFLLSQEHSSIKISPSWYHFGSTPFVLWCLSFSSTSK